MKKKHWYGGDWPRFALTPRVGRGSGMRRQFPVQLTVEFLVTFDESEGLWLVKLHRARGPEQYLEFGAVPRDVRAALRRKIEERMGVRKPARGQVVLLRRKRGV
jgi:hypothetical protein